MTLSYCLACGKYLPYEKDWFAACGECGHVWGSADDLLSHWRKSWEGNKYLSVGDFQDLMAVKAEDIFVCPCCAHDL